MAEYFLIDTPSGWKYGFPKLVPSSYVKSSTLFKIWLMSEGVPSEFIEISVKYCRIIKKVDINEIQN